ncbi:hypothetical protein BIW11_06768 [Tropilaelaps mercedesae]|uniref:Uncharacterized protein n=1 Tax=Tropilaelaps mercedesae TaxID=418985 RepID=A0A1V9XWM0_9ACAR|nr:hypothetical protein BIW11_06768 [Tropilaelaps mercedesae]
MRNSATLKREGMKSLTVESWNNLGQESLRMDTLRSLAAFDQKTLKTSEQCQTARLALRCIFHHNLRNRVDNGIVLHRPPDPVPDVFGHPMTLRDEQDDPPKCFIIIVGPPVEQKTEQRSYPKVKR